MGLLQFTVCKYIHVNYDLHGLNMWNKLPLAVRSAPTKKSFKSKLKAHLFALAYPP